MDIVINATRKRFGLGAAVLAMTLAVGLSFVLPSAAFADPPPWAPAWGWRAKHGNDEYDHGSKHAKKRKHDPEEYEHDDDYDDDDGDDRVVYRRDVVRCDVRRRDGTIGDLAGVLIDRSLGVPETRRENCYLVRSDN